MKLDANNNSKKIDLDQPFFECTEADFLFKVYRYNVYQLLETELLLNDVKYYVMQSEDTNEMFVFGIYWEQKGKILKAVTRTRLSEGVDPELAGYIVDAVVEKLTQQKMGEMKNSNRSPQPEEKSDS